jgi:LmbE family N-acetylglucosaminyl deacetylase
LTLKLLLLASLLLGCTPAFSAPAPKTLVAVFAHPDDEAIIGPLLAAYARKGAKVHLIVVTQGEKGATAHAGIPKGPALAEVRAEEARCACRALGIAPPILLGFNDGELGRVAEPVWGYLGEVESALRAQFAKLRPDVVISFGGEGAYGHPDHRLVGNVVTQIVEAGGDGVPAVLLYPGFPKDRLAGARELGLPPFSPVDPRFLTVRVPYEPSDVAAAQASLACHKSQFPPVAVEPIMRWAHQVLGGLVYLRPWFGAVKGDDVFELAAP